MTSLVLLTGYPYFVAIINLPLLFQVVNGDSPIMAGVHLLPLLCAMALSKTLNTAALLDRSDIDVGSFLGGAASSKKNLTSPNLILATCLILLGCGLMSTLGGGREFYKPTYGYQLILGLGVGLTFSGGTLLTSINSKPEDVGKSSGIFAPPEAHRATKLSTAAAQGALAQARILGGSIGLSIATTVLNKKLSSGLAGVLEPAKIKSLEQSLNTISDLSPANRGLVAQMYTISFNDQMRICTYLSAAALAASATYQEHPASVKAVRDRQNAMIEESSEEGTELDSILGAAADAPQSTHHDRRLHSKRSSERVYQESVSHFKRMTSVKLVTAVLDLAKSEVVIYEAQHWPVIPFPSEDFSLAPLVGGVRVSLDVQIQWTRGIDAKVPVTCTT